jgi:protein TonB
MKILTLISIVLTIASASVAGKTNTIYADVQVTNLSPINDFIWERANENTPKYPVELARSGTIGCAVLSFNISDSGKTENIEVINSLPKKSLGKQSLKMLKEWEWVPTSTVADSVPEMRTLRFDFCMGGESIEQAQNACLQQTKLACG